MANQNSVMLTPQQHGIAPNQQLKPKLRGEKRPQPLPQGKLGGPPSAHCEGERKRGQGGLCYNEGQGPLPREIGGDGGWGNWQPAKTPMVGTTHKGGEPRGQTGVAIFGGPIRATKKHMVWPWGLTNKTMAGVHGHFATHQGVKQGQAKRARNQGRAQAHQKKPINGRGDTKTACRRDGAGQSNMGDGGTTPPAGQNPKNPKGMPGSDCWPTRGPNMNVSANNGTGGGKKLQRARQKLGGARAWQARAYKGPNP